MILEYLQALHFGYSQTLSVPLMSGDYSSKVNCNSYHLLEHSMPFQFLSSYHQIGKGGNKAIQCVKQNVK